MLNETKFIPSETVGEGGDWCKIAINILDLLTGLSRLEGGVREIVEGNL